jgi:hypothetical protein
MLLYITAGLRLPTPSLAAAGGPVRPATSGARVNSAGLDLTVDIMRAPLRTRPAKHPPVPKSLF